MVVGFTSTFGRGLAVLLSEFDFIMYSMCNVNTQASFFRRRGTLSGQLYSYVFACAQWRSQDFSTGRGIKARAKQLSWGGWKGCPTLGSFWKFVYQMAFLHNKMLLLGVDYVWWPGPIPCLFLFLFYSPNNKRGPWPLVLPLIYASACMCSTCRWSQLISLVTVFILYVYNVFPCIAWICCATSTNWPSEHCLHYHKLWACLKFKSCITQNVV